MTGSGTEKPDETPSAGGDRSKTDEPSVSAPANTERRNSSESPLGTRLAAINAAQNPLLEAAQPLLRALSDLPKQLRPDLVPVLNRMLEREVTAFQSLCHAAKIRHEHVVAASYALCTALDEAAQAQSWGGPQGHGDAGPWANQQLAQRFHGDHHGGEKVFLLIGRLAANPQEHIDLLELIYLILGLGFEGRYRRLVNGRRELETIQHRLLAMLAVSRGEVRSDLAPHWQSAGSGKFRMLRSVPVWVSASVLGLASLGLFGWYKYQLGHTGAQLAQQLTDIGRLRAPAPAALRPVNPLRLKALLADEIARGTVGVEEDDRHSAVTFKGDDMFVPGRSQLTSRVMPTLEKVGQPIGAVDGTVVITGHTDSIPIRTREFPNNQVLSEKRARAVADVLVAAGVAPARIRVEGRGDTEPLADNTSAAGRARNRRVEMVVQQGDSDVPASAAKAPVVPTAQAAARGNGQPATASTAQPSQSSPASRR